MSEQPQKEEREATEMDFEARQNLLGFFDLLLKIDMRNNPELYKKKLNENYDDNGNTDNPHKA